MALAGNPATDAAVACMIGKSRAGRRVGPMTNCAAALYAVELALDVCNGRQLVIITCNTYSAPIEWIGHDYADVSARIVAKIGRSKILFRRKKEDRRFGAVNDFARGILQSDDPVWSATEKQTADAIAARVEDQALLSLESPPESSVYHALREYFPTPVAARVDRDAPWRAQPGFSGKLGLLVPQFRVGGYRADFAVIGERARIVVEVDGFAFHSSRESFENDRRRDREILMRGWLVMRFPASEATYEPQACAEQVIELLERGVVDS